MTISPQTLADYETLTTAAGTGDLAGRTLIEVTGADRVQLLHSFTTADVKKLPVGGSCEAFVTSPQGKTIGHGYLFHAGDAIFFDTTPGQAAGLIAHFERYIISEDATLRDVTDSHGEILLAGPQAEEILKRLERSIAQALIKPTKFCGPHSFFLQAGRSELPALQSTLEAAGARRCGSEAVEMVRVEAGTPLFGQDITADNLPQEIGRDSQAISFTKGCYLGQETVARIDALGHVNRQLTGLKFAGAAIPPAHTRLASGDKEVGAVTSAVWSPKISAPLALALIRRAQAKPGSVLTSDCGEATVIPLLV